MRRNSTIILVLALLISLTACSQTAGTAPTVIATAEPVPTTARQVEEQDGVYTVSNVDQLLEAIGPDQKIRLEPGSYDLSSAKSYGKATGNPYVTWQETYDGYELVIQNVDNLGIMGAGKDASILSAAPRYANVMLFRDCDDLFLSGITAGHTEEPGYCSGGVIFLEGCDGVSICEVGLYGCGVTGVTAQGCTNVSVTNSDIYDCSYNGIQIMDSQEIYVIRCRLFDLGKEAEWEAFEVFNLSGSSDITIAECEIFGNRTQSLVRSFGVEQVTLKKNSFRDNEVLGGAFGTFGNFVTLDGNTFEGGRISRWFEDGCGAVDADGNTVTEDILNGVLPEETPAPAEKVTVTVTDVDAFLAAIAPNTEIVLDGQLFDLSTAKDYGGGPKKYYRWEDNFDGPGLVITGVDNLTIRSKDGNRASHTIAAVPRYANVLSFLGCKGLVLSGFTAGHTQDQGECTGGVILLENCERIAIENCGMYGCGILGVQALECTDIALRRCEIYECSYGGVQMTDVTGVVMENCTFRDLGGNNLMFYDCSDVVVDGEALYGQHYDGR